MFAEERTIKIKQLIKNGESVKVSELAKEFNVSETTIRRDLIKLETSGKIIRTHGGALSSSSANFEPSFLEKQDKFLSEKQHIGKIAATHIVDGDTVILDSGTTTQYIVRYITAKDITIITNSVNLANELSEKKDVEVIVTGGTIRLNTKAMVGPIAENVLKRFKADKLFLGANGVSFESGVTTPNYIEASIKSAMVSSAKKVYLAVDSSKFNSTSLSLICQISNIDYIITDKLPEDYLKYTHLGIEFITE